MTFGRASAAQVWFAYPKDPASWGEIQTVNDADSAMNVHEKAGPSPLTSNLSKISTWASKLYQT